MCYAIPGKIIEIKDREVKLTYFGEVRRAKNELTGIKLGDYIYAQGGYAIKKISKAQALSILSVWRETFFELQAVDLSLSKLDLQKKGIAKRLVSILDRALQDLPVKDEELLYLLNLESQMELDLLFKAANFLRSKHLKNSCCVHGIIEFSNSCFRRCAYCGISQQNKTQVRYRMTKPEIYAAVDEAVNKHGFQTLVLQSAEDPAYGAQDLAEVVKEILRRHKILIFISLGEIGILGLEKLYAAGARGLLMRFETGNAKLYARLHPGQNLEARLKHLRAAYRMGYLIITGGLIGLPGQKRKDILDDILLARSLHTEMYSFGPFLPHPQTPLKDAARPSSREVLKVLAVCRIADPKQAKILVTTGFETLDKKARELGLLAGANSVMLNLTPRRFKGKYAIYPKRAHAGESVPTQIKHTLSMLQGLGRAPTDLGGSA